MITMIHKMKESIQKIYQKKKGIGNKEDRKEE